MNNKTFSVHPVVTVLKKMKQPITKASILYLFPTAKENVAFNIQTMTDDRNYLRAKALWEFDDTEALC